MGGVIVFGFTFTAWAIGYWMGRTDAKNSTGIADKR